ncbi:MAG: sialate O-acetylesterase [Lachnospiraceae bacterium]|nr:sialate O-acetylesterase [Lachnospiraceae bacterium]
MKTGNRIVSDGMVLQRGKDFVLTGSGKKDEKVRAVFSGTALRDTVSGDRKSVELKCETRCANNTYEICFPNLPAGGPYELLIMCGKNVTKVSDILVGDVFFMSGQSNMELDVNWIYHSFQEEIDSFACHAIRQFKVPIDYNFDRVQEDVSGGRWVSAAGESKMSFGAIGFFMAKKLYETNHIPIGLIQTAVPGCPIESFLTKENVSLYQNIKLPQACHSREAMKAQIEKELSEWQLRVDQMMEEDRKASLSDEQNVVVPILLENKREPAGIYTFRKCVRLPENPVQDAVLHLGILIEADVTYVNNVLVGQTEYQYPPRRYVMPKEILHKGENEIVVKLLATNGVGRFWEKQKYELELGDTSYDLTGVWQFRKGCFSSEAFFAKTFFEYFPYGVYNAMLAPLMDYPVRAVLWYQGESNTGDPDRYYEKMKTLIQQFRVQMGQSVPFYYVQLAYYEDPADLDGRGWETIRREQERVQDITDTHMIISGDVGSATDLHPQNKKAIGERMAKLLSIESEQTSDTYERKSETGKK